MGFDVANRKAIIYDSGTERFTGTTMVGIANAVIGVLKNADRTANKHLLVRSVETCQNELLTAFEEASGEKWPVTHETTKDLLARGREKYSIGDRGWILDLIVAQLLEEGEGRSIVATHESADNALLEMPEETLLGMVKGILASS
ncbi:hypothetical protein GP486_002871 [Trichoglossum hirsutum]|uniref:Uncharacterized protein n=1 Tax=Trichoglossum hirsutum TaxID=265104 RepID=A0A9P8LE89_9PEZI|nr:hypothetical protein GP486_002871 [Trichoglossum hirsutum]